jgi:hypothetical protein
MRIEKVFERRELCQYYIKIEHTGSIEQVRKNQEKKIFSTKRKPLFLRGVYDYAFLTSLRRAAFP